MDDIRPSLASPTTSRQAPSPEVQRWIEENREALEAWDAWVEDHGLPMAELRQG